MHAIRSTLLATALLLAVSVPSHAVGPAAPSKLPDLQSAPDPHPYDTTADAQAQVADAFRAARRSGRNVLIDLGANWCPDCRMLNGVLRMPQVQPWVHGHFETVMVNVDRFNVNMDIPARYGVKVKQIPTVLVLTPDGRLLNPDGALALGNARHMSPQAQVDLVAAWDARGH